MDYELFYTYALKEIARLSEADLQHDYKKVKALAACYELQEYLAGKLGVMISRGELEDG